MRLPRLREPEWIISHTFAPPSGSPAEPSTGVDFCSSTKWLPPPSVPRFLRSSAQHQSRTWPLLPRYSSKPSHFCCSLCETPSPTGIRSLSRSCSARRTRMSAKRSAGRSVSTARIPQPMSTPTAAGITAASAATTPPMGMP